MEKAKARREFDLSSILHSADGDYLLRNNGDRVEVDSLEGKTFGLYFSASWCGPCRRFTPNLVEVYNELTQGQGKSFEVVFVSGDEDEESFAAYFSEMPWLAIPYSDSDTRRQLNEHFDVNGIPHLVLFDESGKVLTSQGVQTVREYDVDGFPFTPEHIAKLQESEKEAKKNQSLKSLLVSKSRDYVIAADGRMVPVSELEGKTVGLYFALAAYLARDVFNQKLIEAYKRLKEEGHPFEIVMIPLDDEEPLLEGQPWFWLPAKDKVSQKLVEYFELETLPTVVVIGPDGKTLHSNVADAVEEHGMKAYPFTPEKFLELELIEKARLEAQTLESILSEHSDFVIGKDGIKVPVSDLSGKTVLFFFSAHWCPPCRAFLPAMIKAYQEINDKGNANALEVVFISGDKDQESFNEFFSMMPWLAIPFGDERKKSLSRLFKVRSIPTVIAVGPDGRTITTEALELLMHHGSGAYPFTAERLEEIEREEDKMAMTWPKKLELPGAHEHELVLTKRQSFNCDGCGDEGRAWSFYCQDCDFDLHPKCAFGEESGLKEKEGGEKWICDGNVCYKE